MSKPELPLTLENVTKFSFLDAVDYTTSLAEEVIAALRLIQHDRPNFDFMGLFKGNGDVRLVKETVGGYLDAMRAHQVVFNQDLAEDAPRRNDNAWNTSDPHELAILNNVAGRKHERQRWEVYYERKAAAAKFANDFFVGVDAELAEGINLLLMANGQGDKSEEALQRIGWRQRHNFSAFRDGTAEDIYHVMRVREDEELDRIQAQEPLGGWTEPTSLQVTPQLIAQTVEDFARNDVEARRLEIELSARSTTMTPGQLRTVAENLITGFDAAPVETATLELLYEGLIVNEAEDQAYLIGYNLQAGPPNGHISWGQVAKRQVFFLEDPGQIRQVQEELDLPRVFTADNLGVNISLDTLSGFSEEQHEILKQKIQEHFGPSFDDLVLFVTQNATDGDLTFYCKPEIEGKMSRTHSYAQSFEVRNFNLQRHHQYYLLSFDRISSQFLEAIRTPSEKIHVLSSDELQTLTGLNHHQNLPSYKRARNIVERLRGIGQWEAWRDKYDWNRGKVKTGNFSDHNVEAFSDQLPNMVERLRITNPESVKDVFPRYELGTRRTKFLANHYAAKLIVDGDHQRAMELAADVPEMLEPVLEGLIRARHLDKAGCLRLQNSETSYRDSVSTIPKAIEAKDNEDNYCIQTLGPNKTARLDKLAQEVLADMFERRAEASLEDLQKYVDTCRTFGYQPAEAVIRYGIARENNQYERAAEFTILSGEAENLIIGNTVSISSDSITSNPPLSEARSLRERLKPMGLQVCMGGGLVYIEKPQKAVVYDIIVDPKEGNHALIVGNETLIDELSAHYQRNRLQSTQCEVGDYHGLIVSEGMAHTLGQERKYDRIIGPEGLVGNHRDPLPDKEAMLAFIEERIAERSEQ